MTAATYNEAITRILKSEGGYSNNPRDPGGPTNFGITLAVYRQNGHPNATAVDVKAMSVDEAKRIYKLRYANPCGYDALPSGIDYAVLDYAVNSGTGRATKVLRRVVGLSDSVPFSEVLAAINKRNAVEIINAICDERLKFLRSLKTWSTFGAGWSRRVGQVRAAAIHMAEIPLSTDRPPAIDPNPAAPQGKGEVSKPDTTKPIGGGAVAGGTVSTATWWDWITAHPFTSILIGLLVLITIIVIAELLANAWRLRKQNAVIPITPVPENISLGVI